VNDCSARVILIAALASFAPPASGEPAAEAPPPMGDCSKAGIEWTRRLVSAGPITIGGMAATTDGGLVVAGGQVDDLHVDAPGGSTPLPVTPSGQPSSGFLLRLAPDGSVRWRRAIAGIEAIGALAVRPDGTIVVGGISKAGNEASLEGPPPLAFPGEKKSVRVLVGVYADDGRPRAAWSVGTVSAGKERHARATLTALVADKDRAVLAGAFTGVIDLGAGARRRTLTTAGDADIYVASLENDGALGWAVRAGGEYRDAPGPIALGRDGVVSISGRLIGRGSPDPVTFGEMAVPVMNWSGHLEALVGQVDRRGRPQWASIVGGDEPWGAKPQRYPEPLVQEEIAGAVSLPTGETLFVGSAALPALFDGQAMLPAQPGVAAGTFLARVTTAGKLAAATPLGREPASAVVAAPDGDLLVAGELEGVTSYPAAGPKRVTMASAGREDVFIARHTPDGALRWVVRLGGRGRDRAEGIAIDGRGAVTLAARFSDGFSLGDEVCDTRPPLSSTVDLIRIAPGASFPDEDARTRRLVAERAALSALRDEATRAFKDKRWAEACVAYQKVAAARPDSGAAQLDLGLCLQRLGKKKEAIAANREAIALAGRSELDDEEDPATRRQAYLNLYKLGVSAALPKQGCSKLLAAAGCERNLWACVGHKRYAVTLLEMSYSTVLRIAHSRYEIGDGVLQDNWNDDWAAPDEQRDHVDLAIKQSIVTDCHESGANCGEDDTTTTCKVVSADACLGLVGTVCVEQKTSEARPTAPYAKEIRLRPAP
jgi:hypothetical protein